MVSALAEEGAAVAVGTDSNSKTGTDSAQPAEAAAEEGVTPDGVVEDDNAQPGDPEAAEQVPTDAIEPAPLYPLTLPELKAPEHLLGELNNVMGSVLDRRVFPSQGEYGGFVLTVGTLSSGGVNASEVPQEASDLNSILFGLKGNMANIAPSMPNALGTGNPRAELARINMGWAGLSNFSLFQNFTAQGIDPCHIEIGTSSPAEVTAENLSIETSEISAQNLSNGLYTVGNYWTVNPEKDLPWRLGWGDNPLCFLGGNDVMIKTHTLSASHLRVPNFCFSVESGLKTAGTN